MDSLTQIVLGAAIGEAVLGKKAGNKAALWGGVIATIPDLDVIPGNLLFSSSVDQLLFHRGFSHSIVFSLLFAFPFAWLIKNNPRIFLVFFLALVYGTLVVGIPGITFLVVSTIVFAIIGWLTYRMKAVEPSSTIRDWIILTFLCLFTHPILDAFTSYGTQLFWPLKERVAWNTIFVADPLYTLPFLICVVAYLFINRNSNIRKWVNYTGLVWSCSYLIFTVINKQFINGVFEENLKRQNIEYSDYQTKPMPLNNILWSITVNGKANMYLGYYSLLDKDREVNFISFPKNHDIGVTINDQKEFNKLAFFSDNYYVLKTKGDTIYYGDLKFGIMDASDPNPSRFVMSYDIINTEAGSTFIQNFRKESPKEGEFSKLIDRVKGIKFNSLY